MKIIFLFKQSHTRPSLFLLNIEPKVDSSLSYHILVSHPSTEQQNLYNRVGAHL